MAHSYWEYMRLKAIVSTLRFFDGEKPAEPRPDDFFTFMSRDGQREIRVNVSHGSDELFCRRIADQTSYTVFDGSYALSPEYPFPAALEDAEELVLQVLRRPTEYDNHNIVLSGFSSGGNLALAAASNLQKQSKVPKEAIIAVAVFYPPTNMTVPPGKKRMLDGSLPPVPPILGILMNAFRSSYISPGTDPADPRISVLLADPNTFPDRILIITAEKDRLAPEAEELARKLQNADKSVLLKRFDGVAHGWDKTNDEESNDARARDEAYDLFAKFLSGIQERKNGGGRNSSSSL